MSVLTSIYTMGAGGFSPGGRPVLATPNGNVPALRPEVVITTPTSVLGQYGTINASRAKPVNQMQKRIERGQAPKTIDRVDKARAYMEQDNVHFKDGSSLNRDGSWKHGGKILTNVEKEFLLEFGWKLPN